MNSNEEMTAAEALAQPVHINGKAQIAAADLYKTPGQLAYEEDVRRRPNYEGGTSRPTWAELGREYCATTAAVVKDSWEKNPTPR